jgi:N-acyl-D-aspartate/D-glutamate deacylase
VRPRVPKIETDLPGGARRLVQKADGIRATIVNGALAMENGESTGKFTGEVMKGALG